MTSRRPHRLFTFALLTALALGGCDWLSSHPGAGADAGTPTALARLSALKGAVVLERTGHAEPASVGPLFAEDLVETGADGSATITFPDGRTARLGPNGQMLIERQGGGLALRIDSGVLVSTSPSSTPSGGGHRVALSILTPFGITRLGTQPTDIRLKVGEHAAHLEVRLGAVQLVRRNGEVMTARAGQAIQLTLGKIEMIPSKPKVIPLAPIQVVLHVGGRVYLRHSGERRFRRVRSAEAKTVAGDTVRVAKGEGALSLSGTSSEIALSRGATVKIGASGRQAGVDQADLDLKAGEVRVRMAEGRRSAFTFSDLKVSSESGGRIDVARSRRGYRLTARTGDFTVTEGKATRKLSAGQIALASRKAITVREVPEASVRLPPWRNLRVFHARLRRVALTWRKGEGGPYRVSVARDGHGKDVLLAGTVQRTFVNVPAPRRGSLYWRVSDSTGARVASASAHFAPEPSPRHLSRLHNQVTEGSEKTTIYFQDRPPQVTFGAKAQSDAAKYRLAVYAVADLGHPIARETKATARIALPAGALGEGRYVWSLTPLSKAGQPLRGGKMNKLEIIYDNSVPTLVVRSPRNGQRVHGTVLAAGVAPVASEVRVDGRRVTLDDKHRFSVRVRPVGDPPVVVFWLHRAGEPETFTVRVLKSHR